MQIAVEERKWALGVLARADAEALSALWEAWPSKPGYTWLRKPESGLVMVRGRMGGEGVPFNLGEMTVTRCALPLVDALHQRSEDHEAVRCEILLPLERSLEASRATAAAETAASRVEFFTMARGDNE